MYIRMFNLEDLMLGSKSPNSHRAVRLNDNSEIDRLLQSNQFDVNALDEDGETPLHVAARVNEDNSHQEAIRMLLNYGADVSAPDSEGNTALHYLAFRACSATVLNLFFKFNAKIDVKNNEDETPLFKAVIRERVETVNILVKRGANVNQRNTDDGSTLLHNACWKLDEKMIKCLVYNGADINAHDSYGRIPVEYYLGFHPNMIRRIETKQVEEILKLLLEFSDLTNKALLNENFGMFDYYRTELPRKTILEQIAKLQVLNISVNSCFLGALALSQPANTEYLNKCKEELLLAKSSKLKNSWVSYFNLLVDNERKLKNYAGNQDLVMDFNQTDCLKKFPIYGSSIQENMKKGIETRKLYDKSAEKLSDCYPIFDSFHLIIRDVLDCLNSEDYKIFV